METLFKLAGVLLIVLSLVHSIFPKYFKWKTTLKDLPLVSLQMMYVHTFFIAFTVFLMGLLCLSSSELLINSILGTRICMGLGIFWGIRLLIQLFGYSSKLWKGKIFETGIHIFFTLLWSFFTILFITSALI